MQRLNKEIVPPNDAKKHEELVNAETDDSEVDDNGDDQIIGKIVEKYFSKKQHAKKLLFPLEMKDLINEVKQQTNCQADEAIYRVGVCFYNRIDHSSMMGMGDYLLALVWLVQIAENGHRDAMYQLAVITDEKRVSDDSDDEKLSRKVPNQYSDRKWLIEGLMVGQSILAGMLASSIHDIGKIKDLVTFIKIRTRVFDLCHRILVSDYTPKRGRRGDVGIKEEAADEMLKIVGEGIDGLFRSVISMPNPYALDKSNIQILIMEYDRQKAVLINKDATQKDINQAVLILKTILNITLNLVEKINAHHKKCIKKGKVFKNEDKFIIDYINSLEIRKLISPDLAAVLTTVLSKKAEQESSKLVAKSGKKAEEKSSVGHDATKSKQIDSSSSDECSDSDDKANYKINLTTAKAATRLADMAAPNAQIMFSSNTDNKHVPVNPKEKVSEVVTRPASRSFVVNLFNSAIEVAMPLATEVRLLSGKVASVEDFRDTYQKFLHTIFEKKVQGDKLQHYLEKTSVLEFYQGMFTYIFHAWSALGGVCSGKIGLDQTTVGMDATNAVAKVTQSIPLVSWITGAVDGVSNFVLKRKLLKNSIKFYRFFPDPQKAYEFSEKIASAIIFSESERIICLPANFRMFSVDNFKQVFSEEFIYRENRPIKLAYIVSEVICDEVISGTRDEFKSFPTSEAAYQAIINFVLNLHKVQNMLKKARPAVGAIAPSGSASPTDDKQPRDLKASSTTVVALALPTVAPKLVAPPVVSDTKHQELSTEVARLKKEVEEMKKIISGLTTGDESELMFALPSAVPERSGSEVVTRRSISVFRRGVVGEIQTTVAKREEDKAKVDELEERMKRLEKSNNRSCSIM